jgi:pyridine nucleotide-disulfide oxidoreductase family protein
MKRLLLLGGGHAHVHVLQAFAREPVATGKVVMVTPFARQMYSGMVPGLVAGRYAGEACTIPLLPLAKAAQVEFVESSVVALDAQQRVVTLADGREAEYDVLSLDTGSTIDRDAIPGARAHALAVRPIEHFVRLLDALWELAAQRALDVVVIGGGAAGVELAMAFAARLRGTGDGSSRVALVTGGDAPLAGYAPKVVACGMRALKRRGVTVIPERCTGIDGTHVTLGNGARLACDAPVLATGAAAPGWLRDSRLALDEQGFVAVGPTLQSTSHPQVFAAGDVAARIDVVHPRSGVYAVRAGPALALNLRRSVAGGALEPHLPKPRSLNLLSCGDGRAIASWGEWAASGRWAWWWKDRIDRRFVERMSRPVASRP